MNMAEESKTKVSLELPRKPLEPVGDGVNDEQRTAYAKLLADYERIKGMRNTPAVGFSAFFGLEKEPYATAEEYNAELSVYRKARTEYNRRFVGSVETIEMVRAKLDRMSKEYEQCEKNNEKTASLVKRMMLRMEEISKFPQLGYELSMRLRHTYIDPKTGERLYRPDDDVGEGLICVGSRDYTPVLKDE